ncbi:hypothetical protein [Streptomyces sp. NPDC090021]|uniref:hypothetical protein n=1 Tax=Streptomyces sp. NPDC090021 TaxID=3365919 RepID=UPI0038034D01
MIQGFRPSRWLACAALAAVALAPATSACAGPLAPAHRTGGSAAHAARPGHVPADPARSVVRTSARTTADGDDEGEAREELAGSAAGVGRERPGRPVGEPADPELLIASRPLPVHPRTEPTPPPVTPSARPPLPPPPVSRPSAADPTVRDTVSALGTQPNDRAADLAAHILPLGTGFALMGLGLGYLGIRLRRSA